MVRKVSTKKSKRSKGGGEADELVIHCTACNVPQLLVQGKRNILCHPTLHVAICRECLMFAHSEMVPLDDEGYEVYCRWCCELGELVCCDKCKAPYCKDCIIRNFSETHYDEISEQEEWSCYSCENGPTADMRKVTKAALNFQNFMEPSDLLLEHCVKKWSGAEITDSDREDIIKERIKLRRNNMAKADAKKSSGSEEGSEKEEEKPEEVKEKGSLKMTLKRNSNKEEEAEKKADEEDEKMSEVEEEKSEVEEKSEDEEVEEPKKKSKKKRKESSEEEEKESEPSDEEKSDEEVVKK